MKKEAQNRTDEKEATKLDKRNIKNEYVQKDVIQMMSKKKY